jgi:predicted aspartyl protease
MAQATEMGRITTWLELANNSDLSLAEAGMLAPEKVRRARVAGTVDTGATRLVLPESAVQALGLPPSGKTTVRYADHRSATRPIVDNVRLELEGRSSVFKAIVEPARTEALIGAIVLEDLDLIVDCTKQKLVPRDPSGIITEVE